MGGNWLFGEGLNAATAWTELGLAWLVQSTVIIALGMFAAAAVRRRHPAVLSVVYQTTLVAVLAAPLVAFALASVGLTFVSITLPEPRYELQVLVEVLEVADETASNIAAAQAPTASYDNLDQLADEIEATSNPRPELTVSFSSSFPIDQPSFAPNSQQREVAVGPPTLSVSPAPAEPIVRRVWQPVTRTHRGLAALWLSIPAVWLAGSLWLLMRLALDHLRLRSVRRSAVHADAETIGVGLNVARRMNVPLPELLRSPLVASPCLCGLLRPAILLPEEIDAAALPAVLVHELAHRKRGDLVWNLLRHVVVSLLWPQPLIWQLSRRLEAVAEDVCDDYVVALGGCPKSYAAALVAIAQRDLLPSEAAVSLVTFRSMLGQRVTRILDGSRRLSLTVGLAALVVIAAGGATAALMAGLMNSSRSVQSPVAAVDKSDDEAQKTSNDESEANEKGAVAIAESEDDDVVTVRGTVLDPEGKPVAGARVITLGFQREVDPGFLRQLPPPLSETRSNADGSYEISFRKSQCDTNVDGEDRWQFTTIAALDNRFGPAFEDYNTFADPKSATLRFVEDEPIRGRIVDLEGRPVAGARLQLRGVGRNKEEDLSQWISAMREGVSYFNSADLGRPAYASRENRFMHPEPLTTDGDGRFTLRGIGKGRYGILRLTGPGIALADLYVVTVPIENFTVEMGHADFKLPIVYHGSNFQFAAAPEQAISGTVRDADSKQPIAGAKIILDMLAGTRLSGVHATETTSDAQGRYQLNGMPRGEGNALLVIPPDDQPYFMREFDKVPVSQDFAAVNLDLELQRGIWITGRLTEQESGKPVKGRMYYLPWPDNPLIAGREQWHDNHLHGPQTHCLTNADGRYRLVGLPGRGLVASWCVGSPFPQGQGVNEIADLPPKGVFHDIVGSFAPNDLFPTIVKEIRPAEDAREITVDVAVRAGASLNVKFVDRNGRPVSGVSVEGLRPRAVSVGPTTFKSGEQVKVLGLKLDEKRLLIAQTETGQLGKVIYVGLADAQDGQLAITLEPTVRVIGRLLDSAGDSLNSARITARPSTETDYALELPRVYTDARGRFTLTLLPGCAYNISCDTPQVGLKGVAKELAVSPGETLDLGEFDVTQKQRPEPKRTAMVVFGETSVEAKATTPATDGDIVTVRGTVLDPTGKPVARASVFVKPEGSLVEPTATTVSDAAGEFALTFSKSQTGGEAADGWRSALLVANADGYAVEWLACSDVDETKPVMLRLKPEVAIEGRIVDLEHRPVAGATVNVRVLSRSKVGELTPWLETLRRGTVYSKAHPHKPTLSFGMRTRPLLKSATTDADGRFRIAGIGPNTLADLQLTGGGAVTSDLRVVTVPGKTIVIRLGNPEPFFDRDITIYGPGFEHLAEPSQPIVGQVSDIETGIPLAGIQISAKNFAGKRGHEWDPVIVQSDDKGNYRLDGMPRGEGNKVLVYPSAGQPYFPRHLEVPVGSGLDATKLDIALQSGTFIRGRIVNKATGRPVSTKVRYVPWFDNPAIESTKYDSLYQDEVVGHTDADGRFEVVGLPGAGLLMLECRGQFLPTGQGLEQLGDTPGDAFRAKFGGIGVNASYPTAVHKVVVPNGAKELAADIQLDAGERVTLEAVDGRGKPVDGLTVKGIGPVSNQGLKKELSAKFDIEALKPGEQRWVYIDAPARKLGRVLRLSLPVDKQPMRVELQPTSTVTARLLDGNGDPIRDDFFWVSVPHADNWGFGVADVRTDSDGRMRIEGLPTGASYDIQIAAVGINWEPVAESLSVGPGETIDLGEFDITQKERPEPKRTAMASAAPSEQSAALPAEGSPQQSADNDEPLVIRGVVLDPDGKPLGGASVKAYRDSSVSKWAKDVPPMETIGSADGRFAIAMPQVLADGYRSGKLWPVSVLLAKAEGVADTHLRLADEQSATNATIRMTPFSPLEGRIVNLEGRPVAGVTVELHQVRVTDRGELTPYLAALRAGKLSSEIEAGVKPNMILGGEQLRKASITVTDADGRFRLERVARQSVALIRLSGAGIVVQEVEVANAPSKPVPFGDNSHNGDTPFLYGLPFEFAVEPSPPIVGIVRDADSGAPIAGATIVDTNYEVMNKHGFNLLQATTDAEGHYRLEGVRPKQAGGRPQRFVVRSEGEKPYLPFEFNAPEATDGLAPIKHDIELNRGIWIEGQVTDAVTGDPVAAKVIYLPWHDNPRVAKLPEYQARSLMGVPGVVKPNTDDEGRFKLIGIPGRGLLEVLHTEESRYPVGQGFGRVAGLLGAAKKFESISELYAPRPEWMIAVQEVSIAEDAERARQDISLTPGETVTLHVQDAAGRPVPLTQANGLEPGIFVKTRFAPGDAIEVGGLLPNERRLVMLMNTERELGGLVEIDLADDARKDRQVILTSLAKITGRLVDSDGAPLKPDRYERDYIKLFTKHRGRNVTAYATSQDHAGRFELWAIPGLEYRVFAANAKQNLIESLVVAPGETIDLGTIDGTSPKRPPVKRTPRKSAQAAAEARVREAEPADSNNLTFTGTVLSPDGKPHAGAKVMLPYRVGETMKSAEAMSASDGSFRLEVPRADFSIAKNIYVQLAVTADGFGLAWNTAAPFEDSGEMLRSHPHQNRVEEYAALAKSRTLELVPDQPIAGRVINLEGQPVANAQIRVRHLSEKRGHGIADWLKAMQGGEKEFNDGWRELSDTFGALGFAGDPTHSVLATTADNEGRFDLRGAGRDRLAHVIISGPGIESREVVVRTQAGEVLHVPLDVTNPTGAMQTVYPAEFEFAAAPSLPVVGTVRDTDTNKPLQGMVITPEQVAGIDLIGRGYPWIRTVSDVQGHYRLEGLPIGKNVIAAVPAADMQYAIVVGRAEIDTAKPETVLDLRLKRGVRIRGRVVDRDTGEPVVASVEYLPFSDNQYLKDVPGLLGSSKWERVDEEGNFNLVGIPGHGLLTVLALGSDEKYPRGGGLEKIAGASMREHLRTHPTLTAPINTSYLVELNIDESITDLQQNVKLSAGRSRTGTVLDPDGKPLAGAQISGAEIRGFWNELKTDEFTVQHMTAGETRRLNFFHAARNLSGTFEVNADNLDVPLVVTLQPAGILTGRLRFESGDIASRVNLWAGSVRGRETGVIHPGGQYELTDTEGRFTIRGLVPGQAYSLEALRASQVLGYAVKDVIVASGETKDLGELILPDPQN